MAAWCYPRKSLDWLYSGRMASSAMQALMVCVVALNLGCMVAYLNVLADVLSSVGGSIIPPGAEENRALLLAGEISTHHLSRDERGWEPFSDSYHLPQQSTPDKYTGAKTWLMAQRSGHPAWPPAVISRQTGPAALCAPGRSHAQPTSQSHDRRRLRRLPPQHHFTGERLSEVLLGVVLLHISCSSRAIQRRLTMQASRCVQPGRWPWRCVPLACWPWCPRPAWPSAWPLPAWSCGWPCCPCLAQVCACSPA